MARGKATPDRSKIVREKTVAPSRRQRGDDGPELEADAKAGDAKPGDAKKSDDTAPPATKPASKPMDETAPYNVDRSIPPFGGPGPAHGPTADEIARARTETAAMPLVVPVGRPPEMPQSVAPPPLALGAVEDPTHMPGPKDTPGGEPTDRAPAPGHVPRGDSRSLRRGNEFALVYRVGTYVISRFGSVGQRGQWRVVEYPTSSSASHSYAKECSRFVSEGFSDYRD